jgi:hypothetical protein
MCYIDGQENKYSVLTFHIRVSNDATSASLHILSNSFKRFTESVFLTALSDSQLFYTSCESR